MSKPQEFKILDESLACKRFLSLWHRTIQFPDGRQIEWDSVGQSRKGPHFTVIFPFFKSTQKVRIISEYCQGLNQLRYSLPSGGYEDKHDSIVDCARQELREEAHLIAGEMVSLMDEGDEGIPELKWSRNR
jgi:NUDIX domain